MIRVYVDMVADLFHSGHVNFLKQAKECGDYLIVGVHSDKDVASYKRKPIIGEKNRCEMIKSCRYVDKVINNAPLMITKEFIDYNEIDDLNVVKVVSSLSGNALYYTREAIPSEFKKNNHREIYFKQLGINAFRKKSLIKFLSLKRSPLEKTESIDMLRLLENDLNVKMIRANLPSVGVDTKEDLEIATKLMKQDATFFKYR